MWRLVIGGPRHKLFSQRTPLAIGFSVIQMRETDSGKRGVVHVCRSVIPTLMFQVAFFATADTGVERRGLPL